MAANQFLSETLKAQNPDIWHCCLYLPEDLRNAAITLYAFDAEISRIPSLVSEPMPGEIRLQWWRDLIVSGNVKGSGPLAEQLISIIKVVLDILRLVIPTRFSCKWNLALSLA